MITILLNGENTEVPEGSNIEQLLDRLGLTGRRLAVELNQQIIPRGRFAGQVLKAGDKVEIVQAIGGGSR